MKQIYNKYFDIILLISVLICVTSFLLSGYDKINLICTILLILSGLNIFITLILYK